MCFVLERLCIVVVVVSWLVGAFLPVALALLIGLDCLPRGDSPLVVFEDLLALDQGLQELVDLLSFFLFSLIFLNICCWSFGAQSFKLLSDSLN